jgi:hypothetical protein
MSEEQKVPTKDDIVAFLKEQIEVKELQAQLQDLNTRIAKGRAEEIQAISFVAQMTNPQQQAESLHDTNPGDKYILTEEDMEINPTLAEQGLKAGDEVLIGEDQEVPAKRSLKKKK